MAGIEGYFRGTKVLGLIAGKSDEYFNITRTGNGSSRGQINNVFKALMQSDTKVVDGDIVTIGTEKYFVVAKRSSATGTTMCQLNKANCTVSIVEIKKHFDSKKANDYDYEIPMHTDITAFYEDVSARMQMYDLGLISKSTRRFLVPVLPMKLTDRIKFNGENMLIEGINATSYPGSLWIQCSPDMRKTKEVTP